MRSLLPVLAVAFGIVGHAFGLGLLAAGAILLAHVFHERSALWP